MKNMPFSTGDILAESENRYRIIYVSETETVLCKMDISKFDVFELSNDILLQIISNNEISIFHEKSIVFDIYRLSDRLKERYENRKQLMKEITLVYGPKFLGLNGRKAKPELNMILEKYSCPKSTFWRICTKYFQQGMQDFALIDEKAFGLNKGKSYNYQKRPGRKAKNELGKDVIIDDVIRSVFDEGILKYQSGKLKSLKEAYAYIIQSHYAEESLSPQRIPTWWQFYHYAAKKNAKKDQEILKLYARKRSKNKQTQIQVVEVNKPGEDSIVGYQSFEEAFEDF